MKKGTTTIRLVGGLSAALLMFGCASEPAPTAAQIKQQANAIMSKCIRSQTSECQQMRKTFCDGLGRYIKDKGTSISPQAEFGSGWPTVSTVSASCSNIKFG